LDRRLKEKAQRQLLLYFTLPSISGGRPLHPPSEDSPYRVDRHPNMPESKFFNYSDVTLKIIKTSK
jgi:hypothetical protein